MSARGPRDPWNISFAAEVTYWPTGETYGLGAPGGVIHESLLMEGGCAGVEANPSGYRALLEFDLPILLPLDDQPWRIEYYDTALEVRLHRKRRGDQLWSSLDTTTLPEFTRVSIRASPAFRPPDTRKVAEVALENIDMLLAAADESSMPSTARRRLSLRASFDQIPSPFHRATAPSGQVPTATVPLTDEVRWVSRELIPITDHILERMGRIRNGLLQVFAQGEPTRSFTEYVQKIVHDFSFFGRQHASSLRRLHEPVLRDYLLVVLKTAFPAEGEAFHHEGKTDIKVINPENRYEFAVIELKYWKDQESIAELMRQASDEHVTGQEALIVCQVLSRNRGFQKVVDNVCTILDQRPEVLSPLVPLSFRGTSEVLLTSTLGVHGRQIPLLVSVVDLSAPATPTSRPRSRRDRRPS